MLQTLAKVLKKLLQTGSVPANYVASRGGYVPRDVMLVKAKIISMMLGKFSCKVFCGGTARFASFGELQKFVKVFCRLLQTSASSCNVLFCTCGWLTRNRRHMRGRFYQRSTDERRSQAADTSTHGSHTDADVANLGGKDFTGVNVDDRESDADERFAENRQRRRRRLKVWRVHRKQESCDITKMTARPTKVNKQPHLHLRSRDSRLTQFNRTLWT